LQFTRAGEDPNCTEEQLESMRWLLQHSEEETKTAMEVASRKGGGLLPTQMNAAKGNLFPSMHILTNDNFGGRFAMAVEAGLRGWRDRNERERSAAESDKAWQQAQALATDPREYLGANVLEGKKGAPRDPTYRRKTMSNKNRRASSNIRDQYYDILPMPVAAGPEVEQPPELPPVKTTSSRPSSPCSYPGSPLLGAKHPPMPDAPPPR
jgi:hypothetical protein